MPKREYADRLFREGDKVMQIKNNYQLEWKIQTKYGLTVDKGQGVFNGDMGVVREINTYEETITIEYDEHRQVVYPYSMMDELELATPLRVINRRGASIRRW